MFSGWSDCLGVTGKADFIGRFRGTVILKKSGFKRF